jgi:hypothetical protein
VDTRTKVLLLFLVICNTLLLLFLTNLTLGTRHDVDGLKETLVTKSDMLGMKQASEEHILQKNCGKCHAESRFASFHGNETEMLTMIREMQEKMGADITSTDVDKIHASLELLKCNSCHEQNRLRMLGLKSEAERKEIIRGMLQKSNTPTDHDEVDRLNRSYQQLFGF